MDIVRFKGGLGNQMFQYAFLESLRHRNREVKASLGFYEKHKHNVMPFILDSVFQNVKIQTVQESIFEDIDYRWRQIKEDKEQLKRFKEDYSKRFFWVEDKDSEYREDVYKTQNCTFVGYWQTEKYFKEIETDIRKAFLFCNIESQLYELGKVLNNSYCSVHLRRGDYLQNDLYEGICDKEYYNKAIKYMKYFMPDIKFIFFSDDISWVRRNWMIEGAIFCSEKMFNDYQNWYDMYLMSQCKCNIIANSSFSWWGAWLNKKPEKVVIAPKKWLNGENTPDIWCNGWIKL